MVKELGYFKECVIMLLLVTKCYWVEFPWLPCKELAGIQWWCEDHCLAQGHIDTFGVEREWVIFNQA